MYPKFGLRQGIKFNELYSLTRLTKPKFEIHVGMPTRTQYAVGTRVPKSAGQLGSTQPHSSGADLV